MIGGLDATQIIFVTPEPRGENFQAFHHQDWSKLVSNAAHFEGWPKNRKPSIP